MFSRGLQYSRRCDGHLARLNPSSVLPATLFPSSLAVEPSGRFVFVGAPGSISQFVIGADGGVSFNTPGSVRAAASPVVADLSGRYLYAAGGTSAAGTLLQYAIGSDGTLTPL